MPKFTVSRLLTFQSSCAKPSYVRRATAINPSNPYSHLVLVAALALSDRGAEAREALQRYLALPSSG